jgi:hypothetical protein
MQLRSGGALGAPHARAGAARAVRRGQASESGPRRAAARCGRRATRLRLRRGGSGWLLTWQRAADASVYAR